MRCAKCDHEVGGPSEAEAGIAVLVNGNEVIHSYFRCDACGMWTIEHYEDHFITGDTSIWTTGPLSGDEGEGIVELIQACPAPQDKHCRCATHDALYTGRPPYDQTGAGR